jgi:hypothetical protein
MDPIEIGFPRVKWDTRNLIESGPMALGTPGQPATPGTAAEYLMLAGRAKRLRDSMERFADLNGTTVASGAFSDAPECRLDFTLKSPRYPRPLRVSLRLFEGYGASLELAATPRDAGDGGTQNYAQVTLDAQESKPGRAKVYLTGDTIPEPGALELRVHLLRFLTYLDRKHGNIKLG